MPDSERHPRDTTHVIAETRAWVNRAVIGLNLCPFAKAVQVKGLVRYVVCDSKDSEVLHTQMRDELDLLASCPASDVETTLLIHPAALTDFTDFTLFLRQADATLKRMGLVGTLQIASFHPDFQFADAEPDDIRNATNRAPYPTLHLLRESSIDRAVAAFPEAESIFERNMQTMEQLGESGWAKLQAECRQDADSATGDPENAEQDRI